MPNQNRDDEEQEVKLLSELQAHASWLSQVLQGPAQLPTIRTLEDEIGQNLAEAQRAVQAGGPKALKGVQAAAKEGLQELEPVLNHLVHEFTENPRGDHVAALRRASGPINDACQRFVEKARECLESNLMGPLS